MEGQPIRESLEEAKAPLLPVRGAASDGGPHRPPSLLAGSNLLVLAGPLACAAVYLLVDLDGNRAGRSMLAALAWIFAWWLTDAVPMPIASLAPLFLFPLFGIASADEVAKTYMDDVIALVLGSFILALAVEHHNIHRRLALKITLALCRSARPSPPLLLLGICATTAFVSMWMHNTAAAVLMMPVATGLLQRFPGAGCEHPDVTRFSKAVVLGVIYAASIGGTSTLTGTGVNLLLVGMWQSYFPAEQPIGYGSWFLFGFPLSVLLFLALWGILCLLYCSRNSAKVLATYLDRTSLQRELDDLGHVAFAEKMIVAVFSLLVVLWMTRSLTGDVPGWGALFHGNVGDGTVSVMTATLLFVIPNMKREGEKLMDWNKCKKLPWNIVLLLGAGFAIADGVRRSGLTDALSSCLSFLESAPYPAVAPLVCLLSSTVTEVTSNNSTTVLVVPLLIQLAEAMRLHPLLLMVPGAVGAQFAFVLPTGTPSNVVGFSTGHIEIGDMVRTGLALKIAGIAALAVLMPTLGRAVLPISESLVSGSP